MTTAAIILAAGRGQRAGAGVPKQWRLLAGRRMADWTLERFRTCRRLKHMVLVLAPEDEAAWAEFESQPDVILASGGATRAQSVQNGLAALARTGVTRVLIHDVARPCFSPALINAVLDALDEHKAAAPALPVTDALWHGSAGQVTGTQDRAGLFAAQTPQGFHLDAIVAAHATYEGEALDDVEVARAAGVAVAIVPGEADNMKITTAADFARAERILGNDMDIRLGNGFDVHRFGPGDHVTLCGVKIPHVRTLTGHSDADVGIHALCDAIYGALAMGDIGRHFPPSEARWKGAASDQFLIHAVQTARDLGYDIGNVDVTLICEEPKIGPHAQDMQNALATIMGVEPWRVSVKATTSERLGFTGRGEGIAAMTSATLVRP
ncbi:bifunctional 2-C-methyl-D-erythritol 4-phosphate cytidylyltransferase/2-C-methyl-D-erythritol 2,4-cyclodiphosphate synthase [Pontibaca salina]|uniref:Bifunctional enzyme IspD/IspF n=1 Tax=Pontibaca salina TaxID=2795731 RepID=A0A934LXU5_9RHOB|nr:bifunctional 2-C-methyl-D-erythritol 4-phosphate cytidylyltransferase/2-C-methyl-D-erythritol 2,4-cyclodiphosphate synthase [Pontibaca salina]MBI6629037.1 bifunctional 2-C-methyl-D-erythritol 4-phosphate cytidylyltransferase/2-C-methyl-D-erythritol 2,4-cyclodiphosphate synthase [Pontibaca salina]